MPADNRPPVREMVRQAVEALGGDTTNVAVRDWILSNYPGTNKTTISCNIIMATVNHTSRIHYPENHKPRIANDDRYDFLFRPERGRVVRYDPAVHGLWRIVQTEDGSLTVAREGEAPLETAEARPQPSAVTPEGGGGFAAEDQLRDYLAMHLEAIEEGLQIYVDDYGNSGVEYDTPVGRIDLLAEDRSGHLLVIELKVGRSPDAAVGQLLRYMGWVRRHLADGRPIRGLIIAQHASDRLRYAVAELPDVAVKDYRIHITLNDVPPPSSAAGGTGA
jgi:RecB family endonuclease NucS